jgi:hypothetical protein
VAKHGLGFVSSTSVFDLALGEAIHIATHGLNKHNVCFVNCFDDVLGSILNNAKSHFSFKILEIDEGHTFVVVANSNVTLVGVNDKQSSIATRIVADRPDQFDLLERDDGGYAPLVEPHLLDGTKLTTRIHSA